MAEKRAADIWLFAIVGGPDLSSLFYCSAQI